MAASAGRSRAAANTKAKGAATRKRPTARKRTATSGGAAPSVELVKPRGGTVASALTASAARASQMPQAAQNQRIPQWQLDSLAYYDQIGIVRYAAQFWARGLSKIRFYAAEKDDKGEVKETNDPLAVELFERVQDPHGGRTMIASTYGQLRFLTGECYLIWTPETADEPEAWEIVSLLELRNQGKRGGRDSWHRIQAPGLNPQQLLEADDDAFEPLGTEVIVYRLWRRHPAYSMMSDAPMRSVLADCEEIVRCTHTINARLISRLSGPGLFAIPMSWKVKPLQDVAGEENPEEDPFQTRLTQAMLAAISTPGSAESVAPIIVRVPDESVASAKLYKVWDPNEVIRELETREKAMHRYAVGVDMPPGKVEGIEGTTHWNAWAIDKEGMEHLLPVAQDFANDIAGAYLRPAMRKEGRSDWSRFVVGYDAAAAVTNPDEFGDAMKLYEARAVGKAYLRAAGNATDEDEMPLDEIAEALFAATGQVVEVGGRGVVVVDTTGEEPSTGEDTERDMPDEPEQEDIEAGSQNGRAEGLAARDFRILGLAEASLEHVRGRIGKQLSNYLASADDKGGKRCADCVAAARGVPAPIIVAELGEGIVAEYGADLHRFAENAGADFAGLLERQGVSPTQARALQEVLENHAVNTIFEHAPNLPTGFVGRVKALV